MVQIPITRGRSRIAGTSRAAGRVWISFALLLALLCAAVLLVYLPVLPREALLDDDAVALANNGAVMRGEPNWTVAPYYGDLYRPLWRPLATLTLRWNGIAASRGGSPSDPLVHDRAHDAMVATNLALFLVAGLLAVFVFRSAGLGWVGASLAGGALLLHPAQSETIWRLAGRSELLAAVFVLGALLLYILALSRPAPVTNRPPARASSSEAGSQGGQGRSQHRSVAARASRRTLYAAGVGVALLFLAGLLSHEIAIVLPFLIAGYQWTVGRESEREPGPRDGAGRPGDEWRAGGDRQGGGWIWVALLAAVALLWAGARQGIIRGWPHDFYMNPSFDFTRALETGERIRLAFYLPWLYAGTLFAPWRLLPDYTHLISRGVAAPPVVLGDPSTFGVASPSLLQALLGLLVLACALALFFLLRRRRPRAAWGIWILGVALLFVLPLLQPNGVVASSRRLFFPLAGLSLFVADLLASAHERVRRGTRSEAVKRMAGAGLVFAPLAILVLLGWGARSYTARWADEHLFFARLSEAEPDSPLPSYMLAGASMAAGDFERAAAYYEESIGLFPRNPGALLNLGMIRAQQTQHSLAGRILHDAAVVARYSYPKSRVLANAYLGSATLLGLQERDDEALAELHKALEVDSTNVHALARAGILEAMKYETAREGLRKMERAIELDAGRNTLGPRVLDQVIATREKTLENIEAFESGDLPYEGEEAEQDSASGPGME
ncbi:MAG: hypothetical protein KBD56_01180 [Candidatus Eisenbacteria bacterium]|nr:hypothetical protein [Candidatus Eisenbacteria bacterium]